MTKRELLEKYKEDLENLRNKSGPEQYQKITTICTALQSEYQDIYTNLVAYYASDRRDYTQDINALIGKIELYISNLNDQNERGEEEVEKETGLLSPKVLGIITYISLIITVAGFFITILTINSINHERDRKWNIEYVNNLNDKRQKLLNHSKKMDSNEQIEIKDFYELVDFLDKAKGNFTKSEKTHYENKILPVLKPILDNISLYQNGKNPPLTYKDVIEILDIMYIQD